MSNLYAYRPALDTSSDYGFLPDERFQNLGNLDRYEVKGNTLYLYSGDSVLAVTILADDMVRVRFSASGPFAEEEPFSYALDPNQTWSYPDLQVDEADAYLRVDTPSLSLRVNKTPLRIGFYTADAQLLCDDAAGIGFAETDDGVQVRCWKQLQSDESFFGLGDKTFPVDRRGNRYVMWNSDTYAYGPGRDPIYKSIPFFIGLHSGGEAGYGVFFDNSYRSSFDMGGSSDAFYSFGAEGGEMRYYFFAGPSIKTVVERYTELTGRTPLPPKWALGYHQSRWNYQDAGFALWVAHEFRRRSIPLDSIHLDIAYMDGYRVFTWDPDAFPDPQQMNTYLNELGVRSVVIIDPGVKVDPGYSVYEEGLEHGYFHNYPDGTLYQNTVWPGDCHWPDFSNPATRAWWGDLHQFFFDSGVSGFWNDMNEPAVLGGSTLPDDIVFDYDGRGTDHREGHNVYGMLMAKATVDGLLELRPDERPFLLTRACFSGSQRYAAAWTGDNVSTWDHLMLSLRICQSLSASGLALCGPDIGGFAGAPSPELYARWMQAAAFYPFMRTHYSHTEIDQQQPWSFGEEVETICRTYIGLRYKLMPYIYTAFEEHERTGLPPMRLLVFEHQDDPAVRTADDQFYFGPALMVAPVTVDGATSRTIYFPEGLWYDFWTHEVIEGGVVLERAAPLDTLPLFARAGSIVPMHPVMQHTEEFQPEALVLRVYPGTDGTSSVYVDDGSSYGYRQGAYQRVQFSLQHEPGWLTISVDRSGDGPLPYQTLEFQIPDLNPSGITADGMSFGKADSAESFATSTGITWATDGLLRIRTRTDLNELSVAY